MRYYFAREISGTFEEVIEKVTAELKKEGFGVVTEIDVKKTLKEKIDADFRPYKILGACNPHFAHQILQKEDAVGVFLPCNVVVEEIAPGKVKVMAVNPVANLTVVNNPELEPIGKEVQRKLKRVVEQI